MIRKGKIDDIPHIMELTKACANAMITNGIYQWNAHYPNRSAFINDINRDELYVLEINGLVRGTIVISDLMDEEYKPINWLSKTGKNIYIHRLAVHPEFQARGFAQQLMDFAERFSIANNYSSIRLDTFSQNKRNQKFYELRGYKQLGNIYFPKQSTHPFYCYELVF
ncbi:MAG: GNAT family N-acetyltransferase [Winogradskyella sp.]|uniref:GNAT family N-acetyltransferase n=1 Tax=Winogradskyella sp. TaxID=1883156 RepID=UPI0017A16FEA|nr:GNAT family N-acetyltransferase [Winogradskyella sp.]